MLRWLWTGTHRDGNQERQCQTQRTGSDTENEEGGDKMKKRGRDSRHEKGQGYFYRFRPFYSRL